MRVILSRKLTAQSADFRREQTRFEQKVRMLERKVRVPHARSNYKWCVLQERKKEGDLKRAKVVFDQQLNTYRRKYEDALQINKRLQRQMSTLDRCRRNNKPDPTDRNISVRCCTAFFLHTCYIDAATDRSRALVSGRIQ